MNTEALAGRLLENVRAFVQPAIDGLAKQVSDALSALRDQMRSETDERMSKALNDAAASHAEIVALRERVVSLEARELVHGKDGLNAYEVAVSLGYEGGVHAWMESLKGEPGQPATYGMARAAVDTYMAEHPVPVPKDGTSVTLDDVRPLMEAEIAKACLDFERRAQGVLERAIGKIETPENVTREQVGMLCRDELRAALDTWPRPKDGADATDEQVRAVLDRHLAEHPISDGKDADPVTPEQIAWAVAEYMAEHPIQKPKDGADATDEQVAGAVAEYIKAHPIPKPKDGDPGASVTLDDVKPWLESMRAEWALEFERRGMDTVHRVLDRIEKPKDGRDALELKDFEVTLSDDERVLTISLAREDVKVERSFRLSHLIYRGIYTDKASYLKGDTVTYGGSLWIALKDDPSGKPGKSSDWQLAVRHGRDAKRTPE